MKAIVDEARCLGCGVCESTCPEVFEMSDDWRWRRFDGDDVESTIPPVVRRDNGPAGVPQFPSGS